MRRILITLLLVLGLTLPSLAMDKQQATFKIEPVKVFTFQLMEKNDGVKATCSDFQIIDCQFVWGLRYNPETFLYEAYIKGANLTIIYLPNGAVHTFYFDITSSIQ